MLMNTYDYCDNRAARRRAEDAFRQCNAVFGDLDSSASASGLANTLLRSLVETRRVSISTAGGTNDFVNVVKWFEVEDGMERSDDDSMVWQ